MKAKISTISFIKGENVRSQSGFNAYQAEAGRVLSRRKSHYAHQGIFCTLKVSDLPDAATAQSKKIYKKEL